MNETALSTFGRLLLSVLKREKTSFGLVQPGARDWLKKMDWQEVLHLEARRRVFQAHSQFMNYFSMVFQRWRHNVRAC